ncbi:MAG: hypothetical protein Q8O15_07635 [Rectinemataceae bacterium]|nr:hypothetical protein [Rectinemataceae bacterium]
MGKRIHLAFILFFIEAIFCNAQTDLPPSDKPWTKTELGSYRIERVWVEYDTTYALVSYRNTTEQTFKSKVSIKVFLYDKEKNMLDTNSRSFFAFERGPITPGFEDTVKVPVTGVTNSVYIQVRLEAN